MAPAPFNYQAMAKDDDYDPAKPEYIIPASKDEMEHATSKLLKQQIASLEMLLEHSKHDDCCQHTNDHCKNCNSCKYELVLADMRYEASSSRGRSIHRVRSDPGELCEHSAPCSPDTERERASSAPVSVPRCTEPSEESQDWVICAPADDCVCECSPLPGVDEHHGEEHEVSHSKLGSLEGRFPAIAYDQVYGIMDGAYANPVLAYGLYNPYNMQYGQFGPAWDMTCSSWWGPSPMPYPNPYNSCISFAQRF